MPAFLITTSGRIKERNAAAAEIAADVDTIGAVLTKLVRSGGAARITVSLAGGQMRPTMLLVVVERESNQRETRGRTFGARWRLTPRETEVLMALAVGDGNKDIAVRLACAPRTIERHVGAILEKAKVASRARLVALFWEGR